MTIAEDPVADQPIRDRQAGPVNYWERVEAIDVLRGVALFGVLAINLVSEFRVSIFEQFLSSPGEGSAVDRAIETFLSFAVDMKAFALFSILFGVGLAIQFDRLAASGQRAKLLARRLIVLLAIGLFHLFLIWSGDILTEYALAGFIVLPFLYGTRLLLGFGAALFLTVYLALPSLLPPGIFPSMAVMMLDIGEANRIYGMGGFFDVLIFRVSELPLILPLHVYVFPRTVSLFLVGSFVWRTGLLRSPPKNNHLLFYLAAGGIGAGTALICVGAKRWAGGSPIEALALHLGDIILALGYGSVVLSIAIHPNTRVLLHWAAAPGRMAFTNYLAQSLIFGWMFYGYGLGLFDKLGAASALAIGVLVYALQTVLSAWWLRRYRYGPIEWCWRTLMYAQRQPFLLHRGT